MHLGLRCEPSDLVIIPSKSDSLGARPRVLVVDDDEAVRSAFELALYGVDCELVFADGGIAALEYVSRDPVDVIFIDLRMPGMDGVRTLRSLRPLCPEARVCILSAFVEEHMGSLIDLASESMDFEIFRKPLDIDEIRTLTMSLLAANCGHPYAHALGLDAPSQRRMSVSKLHVSKN